MMNLSIRRLFSSCSVGLIKIFSFHSFFIDGRQGGGITLPGERVALHGVHSSNNRDTRRKCQVLGNAQDNVWGDHQIMLKGCDCGDGGTISKIRIRMFLTLPNRKYILMGIYCSGEWELAKINIGT